MSSSALKERTKPTALKYIVILKEHTPYSQNIHDNLRSEVYKKAHV